MSAESTPSLPRLILIYTGLVLVALVWGNAFVAIRYVVQFITPIELAAVRFLPVVVLFGGWLLASDRAGVRQLFKAEWRKLLYMALVGVTTYHLAINTGEMHVSAGTASLIIALSPAVSVVLSAIWLRERITLLKLGGLVVSFVGLVVVVAFEKGVQFQLNEVGSYLLILLAAVVWGSYSVVGQAIPAHHPRLRVTAVVLTVAGLPLVALAPVSFWPRFAAQPPPVWGAVTFLSLLCTVFAYVTWLYGVKALGAARVQSFNYLVPLFAVLSGAVLLGEPITWGQVGGGALIIAGVVAINQRK